VERPDETRVITFLGVAPETGEVTLDENAAHHARVRRLAVGDAVAVASGSGHRVTGHVASLTKRALVVSIEQAAYTPEPPPIHLYVPVADKDRMLWLAEKATELQVTSWTPVMYSRSKSVSPRGDGEAFDKKILARMVAALEQSGGAWLPTIEPVRDPADLRGPDGAPRFVLERSGVRFGGHRAVVAGVHIAVGPEGGLEAGELTALRDAGWIIASLGDVTLRFETAAIAALAIARSAIALEQDA
jgi:16S rRNA (uracil1498-N3)-methyltransferase